MMHKDTLSQITPVVLAGGVGRRLWPLSRAQKPKPFLTLPLRGAGRGSLFQQTLARVEDCASPVIVAQAAHRSLVRAQMDDAAFKCAQILWEPAGRNTAPALAVAAQFLARHAPEQLMLALPSDHAVRDFAPVLQAAERAALAARAGRVVTFGIKPRGASPHFGYIHQGDDLGDDLGGGVYHVNRFVEKPDQRTAQGFLAQGGYAWNSGMFLFHPVSFLSLLKQIDPVLYQASYDAVAFGARYNQEITLKAAAFAEAPAEAFDRAVMEKTDRAAVVPVDMAWRDVGTWPSFLAFLFGV